MGKVAHAEPSRKNFRMKQKEQEEKSQAKKNPPQNQTQRWRKPMESVEIGKRMWQTVLACGPQRQEDGDSYDREDFLLLSSILKF